MEILGHRRFFLFAFLFSAFGLLGHMLWLRPYFGFMDDFQNLTLWREMVEQGFAARAWEFIGADPAWGMLRIFYPPMIFGVYAPGALAGPLAFYACNWLFTFVSLGLVLWPLSRLLGFSFWLGMLASLAWPHFYDLLQHPSLQEKIVFLAGAGILWATGRLLAGRRRWWDWALLAALTLLGGGTKPQVLIFYAACWWLLLVEAARAPRHFRVGTAAIIATGLLVVVGLARIAAGGHYTAKYSGDQFFANLLSPYGIGLLGLAAVAAALAAWKKHPRALLVPVSILAFLTMFLGWGYSGYLSSILTPFFAAFVGLAFRSLTASRGLQRLAAAGLLLAALLVGHYRTHVIFTRLQDIGRIVALAPEIKAKGIERIWLTCEEGATSLQNYFRAHAGVPIAAAAPGMSQPLHGEWLLFDSAMCPLRLSGAAAQACVFEDFYTSRLPARGYHLAQARCGIRPPGK